MKCHCSSINTLLTGAYLTITFGTNNRNDQATALCAMQTASYYWDISSEALNPSLQNSSALFFEHVRAVTRSWLAASSTKQGSLHKTPQKESRRRDKTFFTCPCSEQACSQTKHTHTRHNLASANGLMTSTKLHEGSAPQQCCPISSAQQAGLILVFLHQ